MKTRFAVSAVALLLLSCPAFALKVLSKVTPEWTPEHGITVKTEKRDDGTIGFTVTRYLDKAHSFPADSEMTIDRHVFLSVRTAAGLLSQVEPAAKIKNNTLIYWFTLSRACVPHSQLNLSEYVNYKDPKRAQLIGGGTIYEFDLAAFAAPLLNPKPLYHP